LERERERVGKKKEEVEEKEGRYSKRNINI